MQFNRTVLPAHASSSGFAVNPGDVVAGRYRIEGVLGEGGMGCVYEATQLLLDRRVALKVILPKYAEIDEVRRRFEREAKVASKLRHPHAVEIYDFGEFEGNLFLCMRLLRGVSLRQQLETNARLITIGEAFRIVAEVADVLQVAHQAELVHRDLKPDNIFLERSEAALHLGDVQVLDFGLAFIHDQKDTGATRSSSKLGSNVSMGGENHPERLTQQGVVAGTPAYMSPEQAQSSDRITAAADIYSLGCVLYELLTLRQPFEADEIPELLAQHLYVEPVPPQQARPGLILPAVAEELLQSMLAKHPRDRPDAGAVYHVLQTLLAGKLGRSLGERSGLRRATRANRSAGARPMGIVANARTVVLPMESDASEKKSLEHAKTPLLGSSSESGSNYEGDLAGSSRLENSSPTLSPNTDDFPRHESGSEWSRAEPTLWVAFVGPVEEGLRLALAANGLRNCSLEELQESHGHEAATHRIAGAVFASQQEPEVVYELSKQGFVVVADAKDFSALSALLRAGAAEVSVRPIDPGRLAKQLRRAWDTARRRSTIPPVVGRP